MPATLTIDPNDVDEYIPIEQAGRYIPGRPHRATTWRWWFRGLKRNGETIRLRTVAIAGRRYLRREWIDEFLTACNGGTPTAPQPDPCRKSHDVAAARLDALFTK